MKLRRVLRWLALAAASVYALVLLALLALRWVNPPLTAVQFQRRLEGQPRARSRFLPLARISPHLQHAVIAAEDSRFYSHRGIDWQELHQVLDQEREGGASTLTQQLVKNVFFTTYRNPLRKAAEFTLAPAADLVLGKQRILELYLNVVEWGPGMYGAQAAAWYHYRTSPARLTREQAARLAAILPAPRRRKPDRMHRYSAAILERMSQLGW